MNKKLYCWYNWMEPDSNNEHSILCEFIRITEGGGAEVKYLDDCDDDGIGAGSTVILHPHDIEFLSDDAVSDLKTAGDIPNDSDNTPDQTIKADAGKARLSLVPTEILFDIAKVREYGLKKYGTSESWKQVDVQRYRDATYRHWLAYLNDPTGMDEESGLPHLWHFACNAAFLCDLEKGHFNNTRKENINHENE